MGILNELKRELLLLMKTNNYLRAIDRRLGNPNNTFAVINDFTWAVFSTELRKQMGYWAYMKEFFRYQFLNIVLFAMYLNLRIRIGLGLSVDENKLQDFDLDVTYREDILLEHG